MWKGRLRAVALLTAVAWCHGVLAAAPTPEIKALRLWPGPDSTRAVFDVSGPASFTQELNNRNKMLSISIPDTEWHAAKTAETLKSPLIEGYTTTHEGNATIVALTLRKPATPSKLVPRRLTIPSCR